MITDEAWLKATFVPKVGKRGAEIIAARGASSAASAANAVVDTVRDLVTPSRGEFHSLGVASGGEYGTPKGIVTSLPVKIDAVGNWRVEECVELNEYAELKIAASNEELIDERRIAFHQLGIQA